MTIDAGEKFILHAPDDFSVEDPDGEEIYASCNIGTCKKDPEGNFMWTFLSDTPGSYMVEIVFYDIRGGYGVMEFTVEVNP